MTKRRIHIGRIRIGDLKVRKKSPPPTQVQKSPKNYDRNKLKREICREFRDE